MNSDNLALTPLAHLYLQVLRSPGNEALLQKLRARAQELRAWLDEDPSASAVVDAISIVPPAWLARIYRVLAEPCESATPDAAWKDMLKAYTRDEWYIGEAFSMLLAGVAPKLTDLAAHFGCLPAASEHVRLTLANYPDVKGGGGQCEPLVRCGLTPVRVWCVTSSVVPLVERLQRHQKVPAGTSRVTLEPLRASSRHAGERTPLALESLLRREVVQTGRCTVQVAEVLWGWLLQVAAFRPYLFAGGIATVLTADTVTLEVNAAGAHRNPAECWGLSLNSLPEEVGEATDPAAPELSEEALRREHAARR